MPGTQLIDALTLDPDLVLSADYVIGATDRQFIAAQIRGLQQHVVQALIRGQICTFAVATSALSVGDVVCSAPVAATESDRNLAIRKVTLATSAALADAGIPLGVALTACAVGGWVLIAIEGVIGSSVTGLGAGVAQAVAVDSLGRAYRRNLADGDFPLGYVDTVGNLTLGRSREVDASGGGGGGGDSGDHTDSVAFNSLVATATITGTQHNLTTAGLGNANTLLINVGAGGVQITGIVESSGLSGGRMLMIQNSSNTDSIYLLHDQGSTLSNRFYLPTWQMEIPPQAALLLQRNAGNTRWLPAYWEPTLKNVLESSAVRADGVNSHQALTGDVELVAQRGILVLPPYGVYTPTVLGLDADPGSGDPGEDLLVSGGAGDGAGAQGNVDVGDSRIINLSDPVDPQDAATKNYVDGLGGGWTFIDVTALDSPYTAPSGKVILTVETATSPVTIVLPSPSDGDHYIIKDGLGSASSNNITIEHTGYFADGTVDSTVLDADWQSLELAWDPNNSAYTKLAGFGVGGGDGGIHAGNFAVTTLSSYTTQSVGFANNVPAASGIAGIAFDYGSTEVTVTGISEDASIGGGRILILLNVSATANLTIANGSGLSNPSNRFSLPRGQSLVIPPRGSMVVRYDADASAWAPFERGTPSIQDVLAAVPGDVDFGSYKITNLDDPTNPQDAATKAYVDSSAPGGGAPGDAQYLTATSDAGLSAERVITDTTSITWDIATAGQVKVKRAALTGDVTASADSNATTIADNAVTMAKLADLATDKLIGRDTAGSGDPEAIGVGGGIEFTGTGALQRSALTGDVTASAGSNATTIANDAVTTAKILNDAVTYAKLQNVSATDRLLGRDTAAAGDVEELTVGGGVEFTGTGGIQRSALTGDVTASAGSNATTIATAAVTLAKMANLATDRLIGRDTTGTGVPEALTVGGGLEFTGSGGIQRSALTGDVTCSAGSGTTAIAANAVTTAAIGNGQVTYAKIQNISVTDRLLGRDTAGAGSTEELTVGGGVEFTGSGGIQRSALTGDVTASAGSGTTAFRNGSACSVLGRSANSSGAMADIASSADGEVFRRSAGVLGWGTIATAGIADDAVTYAKIQNVSAASRVLGRGSSAGAGDVQELTLGSGLSLTGTVLDTTGGGGGGAALTTTLGLGNTTQGYDIRMTFSGIGDGDAITFEVDDTNYDLATILVEDPGDALAITGPAGVTGAGGKLKLRGGLGSSAADGDVVIDRGALDVSKAMRLSGDISPTQLSANTNDWAPTNLSTATVIRASTDASRNLTGLTGGADGRLVVLMNVGSNALVLKNEDASSTAANRLALGGGDVTLAANQGCLLCYDSTSSRWRLAGGAVANDSITFAKMQNVATDRLIGRDTASSGDPEELTVGGGIEFTGSGGIQRSALTGDATASAGSGAITVVQASGAWALPGDITPSQITADQNDYAPTGHAGASVIRISSDAIRAITGLAGGADGRIVALRNVGSFPILFTSEDAASTAANRFSFVTCLGPGAAATLMYDATTSRWFALSLPRATQLTWGSKGKTAATSAWYQYSCYGAASNLALEDDSQTMINRAGVLYGWRFSIIAAVASTSINFTVRQAAEAGSAADTSVLATLAATTSHVELDGTSGVLVVAAGDRISIKAVNNNATNAISATRVGCFYIPNP